MSPDRWREVSDLFDRVADLPPAERAAFLDREALGPDGTTDGALREEVERLLALDAEVGTLDRDLPRPAPPGAGPWTLHELLGVGGMGEVWRATRDLTDGLRQSAAVKLVRPGLGERLTSRFRTERRILAGLDHPAIARLLDAGTATDGRPYFATDLVEGEPITAFCDRRRLGVNERLALFVGVCEAVAYAHARLVVHRDLKPGNVLVAEGPDDTAPSVKLLDFGIAKLLEDSEEEALTQTGRPVLTPAYAAPEQHAGGSVTTATDVYGLGVLLYELLTGTRPSREDLTRPSEAVTTSATTGGRVPPDPARPGAEAEGATDSGSLRSTTPDRLRRRLRGDLDRICLKALREDPERRYRGASELGADVQRHLDGLPVEARPESTGYRVGKFVRRNRGLTAAVAVALAAVVGGAGVALWKNAEAQASEAQAVARAAEAEAATGFLVDLFEYGDPSEALGDTLTVLAALDRGAARLEEELDDEPALRSRLLRSIGAVYRNLGAYPRAETLLRRSVRAAEASLGPRHPETALTRVDLSLALLSQDQDSLAYDAFADAADALRQPGVPTLDLAHALDVEGRILAHLKRFDESEARHTEAVRLYQASGEASAVDYATALNNLGMLYHDIGQYEPAREAYSQSLALRRQHLPRLHPDLAESLNNFAIFLRSTGDTTAADALFPEVLELDLALYGPRHEYVAADLENVAGALMRAGKYREAEPMYEEAASINAEVYGPGHREVAKSHLRLAQIYAATDREAQAEPLLLAAHRTLLEARGPTYKWSARSAHQLADFYRQTGDAVASARWRQTARAYDAAREAEG